MTTVPNRRHVYLLLRTHQVPSNALVCPSSKDVAIRNAIGVAAKNARLRLNEKIVRELEAMPQASDSE